MKTIKFLLIAVLFIGAYSASAQWVNGTTYTSNTYSNKSFVGIGDITDFQLNTTSAFQVQRNMTEPMITIHNNGGAGGASFAMIDNLSGGYWKFKVDALGKYKIRDNVGLLNVFTIERNSADNSIYIKAGGNVGIGTSTPTTKLDVNGIITCTSVASSGAVSCTNISANGKITTKEVEVTLSAFPDYVFDAEYQLSPLSEVEKYIKENKHLKGIPTAKEVVENGLSLGEMNVKLMEKVEELTLYVIQLQKEVDQLKKE